MLLLTCSDGNDPIKEIEKPKEENPFITLKKKTLILQMTEVQNPFQ